MKFEDLEVWQAARVLVPDIYRLTRTSGLAHDFGVCHQIQRASVSIMTNIAQGFERIHAAEKVQFYNTARSSCGEVRSLLYVIEDNCSDVAATAAELRPRVETAGRLNSGLIRSTRSRNA